MKTYWDSSALIEILHTPSRRTAFSPKFDVTRTYTLAEVYSTLTKGVNYRYPPDDAAKMIEGLAEDLDFIQLSKGDTLATIKEARAQGVRGARIHDLMHATAARKCGASTLMTLDLAGFTGLAKGLKIETP